MKSGQVLIFFEVFDSETWNQKKKLSEKAEFLKKI